MGKSVLFAVVLGAAWLASCETQSGSAAASSDQAGGRARGGTTGSGATAGRGVNVAGGGGSADSGPHSGGADAGATLGDDGGEPIGGAGATTHQGGNGPTANGGEAGAHPAGDAGAAGEAGAGAGSQTVRIASFNIRDFGPTKAGKPEVMHQLAEIIRSYPLVAVQEISDASQTVPYTFLQEINATGRLYDLLLSPRSGQQADDRTYQEQYAFYYDTRAIDALSSGVLFDDSANDWFVREPYLARFRVRGGGLTFAALTFHAQPDTAVAEIGHLDEVMRWASQTFPEEDDLILLGDLDAGCTYASPAELDALPIRGEDYVWVVPDSADTNVAASVCAYDRIVVTRRTISNLTGAWGVEEAFTDNGVSDHWPVWAELWGDERD